VVTSAAGSAKAALGKAFAKAKAKAKAKALTGPGDAPATSAQAEKEVKDVMAKEVQLKHHIADISSAIQQCPADWQWSTDFMRDIAKLEESLAAGKADREGFYNVMIASALSPGALKAFRKKHGTNYHLNLLRVIDTIRPLVNKLGELVTKVDDMAAANNPAGSSSAGTPIKKKQKKS
jgi:hypothetical protein